jgi:hypothetical protein
MASHAPIIRRTSKPGFIALLGSYISPDLEWIPPPANEAGG